MACEEGHSVLVSYHIISDLEKICDYVTFLHKGSILFSQDKETLLESYLLVRCLHEHRQSLDFLFIFAAKTLPYSEKVLMRSDPVPSFVKSERLGIEQIMVMMAKGRA
jgi:ABC-2 type transport system ATP-binding protein